MSNDSNRLKYEKISKITRLLRNYRNIFGKKIRVGNPNDGGYVIDAPSPSLSLVISLGISDDVSFDLYFAEQGLRVIQFDPSIDAPPVLHPRFEFHKLAVGYSKDSPVIQLNDILIQNRDHLTNTLLKMDIEGAEWSSIATADESLLGTLEIIVGEFHFFEALNNEAHYYMFHHVLTKLSKSHVITHIHPNNDTGVCLVDGFVFPRLMEISWLRKDLGVFVPSPGMLIDPLDMPNNANLNELYLPSFWHY
jgi:hypothetical protein